MELIELVEVAMTEWDGTPYVNVYEVYEGDFVLNFNIQGTVFDKLPGDWEMP